MNEISPQNQLGIQEKKNKRIICYFRKIKQIYYAMIY
jgi:hypothetical protein